MILEGLCVMNSTKTSGMVRSILTLVYGGEDIATIADTRQFTFEPNAS